jgi:hypothetical protein
MKRLTLSLALVLILTTAASAETPIPSTLNFNVGGGINIPSYDEAKNGYILGGGVGYRLMPNLVLGGEVSYLGYGAEEGTSTMGDVSMKQHFIEYGGTARYYFSSGKASPYVKGFAGRFKYATDLSGGGLSIDYSYSDMQYGGGVGLLLRGSAESNLYIEGLYHSLQGEEDSAEIITVTMGMDIDFKL